MTASIHGKLKNSFSWNVFYEKAWQLRMDYIRRLIEEGEVCPYRIMKRLEVYERHNTAKAVGSEESGQNEFAMEFEKLDQIGQGYRRNIKLDKENPERIEFLSFNRLPTGFPVAKRCAFFDRYYQSCYYTDFNHISFLLDYLYNKSYDAVVELGSGYSQNLIKLFYEGGPRIPYYGGEYTQSGTKCAKMLGELNAELNLHNFIFDFNSCDKASFPKFDKILVFTRHSIEQVELLNESTLSSISQFAREVTCMHFEPFGFQIPQEENLVDINQGQKFSKFAWNKNLMKRLTEAHNNGIIDLEFVGKNIMGSTDAGLNPTSIALWHSV